MKTLPIHNLTTFWLVVIVLGLSAPTSFAQEPIPEACPCLLEDVQVGADNNGVTMAISELILPPPEMGPIPFVTFDAGAGIVQLMTDHIPPDLLQVKMNGGRVKIKDRCGNKIVIRGVRPIPGSMMMLEAVADVLKFRVGSGNFCGLLPAPRYDGPSEIRFTAGN